MCKFVVEGRKLKFVGCRRFFIACANCARKLLESGRILESERATSGSKTRWQSLESLVWSAAQTEIHGNATTTGNSWVSFGFASLWSKIVLFVR
jgi:hypothetical protein